MIFISKENFYVTIASFKEQASCNYLKSRQTLPYFKIETYFNLWSNYFELIWRDFFQIPRVVDTLDQGINYTKAGFDKDTIFGKDMYVTRAYFVPQGKIMRPSQNQILPTKILSSGSLGKQRSASKLNQSP